MSSPQQFHDFSHASCVNLTQLHSQSSWFSGVSFTSRDSDSASCRPHRRSPLLLTQRKLPFFLFLYTSTFFPASGQAVVTGVVPSPRFLLTFNFYRAYIGFSNQSHCSSIFHRVLLTHALAFSASQFVHKHARKKLPTNVYEYALGGIRTHETNLYQARG